MPLKERLYPFERFDQMISQKIKEIKAAEKTAKATKAAENPEAQKKADKIKQQAVLNNINVLTKKEFSKTV